MIFWLPDLRCTEMILDVRDDLERLLKHFENAFPAALAGVEECKIVSHDGCTTRKYSLDIFIIY
jgi:hypothetical protein